jgi:hypothetical protein
MNNSIGRKRMLTVSKPADINPTVAHIRSFSFTAPPDSNTVEHMFGLYIEDIPSLCKYSATIQKANECTYNVLLRPLVLGLSSIFPAFSEIICRFEEAGPGKP